MFASMGGPTRWDWTRNKESANAMLKEKNNPPKVKNGPFERLIDFVLTALLITATAYFIYTLFL